MRKMTFSNLGFTHTSSLLLSHVVEMSTKRLITMVSVSLSSAGAWRMGSIPAVVTGGGGVNDTGGFT